MSKSSYPSLYTIPVHLTFADALVTGIIEQHGSDVMALAGGLVLLPNSRAVTAVRDAFIRQGGGSLLLPRLVALGDEELDESVGAALDRIDVDDMDLPPAMPSMSRRFRLAQMVARERPDIPAGEALRLGDGLARVFDALAIEDVPLDSLTTLERHEPLAEHWETAFGVLQQLAAEWPAILRETGMIDRSRRRNMVYDRTSSRWARLGLPADFVIAAGISTPAPAIARLLKTIAWADGGAVVLPHLDLAMDEAWWDALGADPQSAGEAALPSLESHPHQHLKLLLNRMDMRREDVRPWPVNETAGNGPAHRQDLVRHAFAPASFTAGWLDVPGGERRSDGIAQFDCATPAEEALTIALAMREVLETPGKTAALVTPDRSIAIRVAGHLGRWGITADDSAGKPLASTTAGGLALALASAMADGFAPVALISLLSHPLVRADEAEGRRQWMDQVRQLDLVLRGPRPAAGLAKLSELLAQRAQAPKINGREKAIRGALLQWWLDQATPLLSRAGGDLSDSKGVALVAHLSALRQGLSALSDDNVWAGADGRALSSLLEEVESVAGLLDVPLKARDLPSLLRQLMQDVAVRPPQGGHPRLFIWGLIEGRLQRADRMILAGLNEGQWPQKASPDPWLPPTVRRSLGLPGLERSSGLAAHDFASALGSPEVIITRSQRDGPAPTVPSRLLLRLTALAGEDRIRASSFDFAGLAGALDSCESPQPFARPAFAPSADRRPRSLSVTEVDTLVADPFAFYARNALGLRQLDPLDAEPTAAWRGTLVHAALEHWLKQPHRSIETIGPIVESLLAGPGVSAVLRALWGPRLFPPLQWAAETVIADQLASGRVALVEASESRGTAMLGAISLSGTPDRIDRLADGSLAIVDYKTGSGPNKKAVESLFALQLGLLGLIAEAGGYTGKPEIVSTFEYWRMNKSQSKPRKGQLGWIDTPFRKTKDARIHPGNFVAEARARLEGAVARWLVGEDAFIAKLEPEFAPYADYDQLMRLEEWYGRESGPDDPGDAA